MGSGGPWALPYFSFFFTDLKTGITIHQGLFIAVIAGNGSKVFSIYNFNQDGHDACKLRSVRFNLKCW